MPARKTVDDWNKRYRNEPYAYRRDANEFFKVFVDSHDTGMMLLPAEGAGNNAVYAAKKGWDVLAFDFSDAARKRAMKIAREAGVKIRYDISDLSQFRYTERSFDAVGLFFVQVPSPLREAVHQAVISCLKPGGYLILEAFNKRQNLNALEGPDDTTHLFSMADLQVDFNELEILILEEFAQHDECGISRRGESETIRLLGRRT